MSNKIHRNPFLDKIIDDVITPTHSFNFDGYHTPKTAEDAKPIIEAYKAGLRKGGVKVPQGVEAAPVPKSRNYRRVPTYRLVTRLGLGKYDRPAPYEDTEYKPKKVKLMLTQHIGAPGKLLVAEGDSVKAGQLISSVPDDALGAFVHASIDGKVTHVTEKFIIIEAE